MVDEPNKQVTVRVLESPPRTTGNAQQDFPLIIDWIYQAYLTIRQSVVYINSQLQSNPDFDITTLPDPNQTTLAQAQTTANQAYSLADEAKELAEATEKRIDDMVQVNQFTISETNNNIEVTFAVPRTDTNYVIIAQPKSYTGTAAGSSFIIIQKAYFVDKFSVTLLVAPGVGNSVTYEWVLIETE